MIYSKLNKDSTSILLDSACQKIDTQRQCYVMDLFCQDQMSGEDGVNSILIILGVGFAAVVLIIGVCIYLCICKRSRKSAKGAYNEYKSLSYPLINDVI